MFKWNWCFQHGTFCWLVQKLSATVIGPANIFTIVNWLMFMCLTETEIIVHLYMSFVCHLTGCCPADICTAINIPDVICLASIWLAVNRSTVFLLAVIWWTVSLLEAITFPIIWSTASWLADISPKSNGTTVICATNACLFPNLAVLTYVSAKVFSFRSCNGLTAMYATFRWHYDY